MKNAATSEKVLSYSNGVIETVAVYSEKENLFICAIYRQPDDSTHKHKSGVNKLNQALTLIGNVIDKLQGTPDILLCGDFNLPNAHWYNGPHDQIANQSTPAGLNNALVQVLNGFQNKYFLT